MPVSTAILNGGSHAQADDGDQEEVERPLQNPPTTQRLRYIARPETAHWEGLPV